MSRFFAVLMVLGLFVGCSEDKKTTPTTPADKPADTATDTSTDKPADEAPTP